MGAGPEREAEPRIHGRGGAVSQSFRSARCAHAVRYYAAFPTEIDELLERQSRIAERELKAAERERAILR